MRFTVKRYDAVPTTESGGDGDGVGVGAAAPEDEDDDAAGQRATPPRDSPDTLSPEALTPRTPPSPSSMSKLPIAKLPPADVDLLDSTPMDSYTSTLFGREAQERDAVAHRGRLFAKSRDQRRLVLKEGNCNISLGNVKKRRRRFLHDIFTTLLELRWRWHLVMFSCVFLLTWIIFAVIWYIILILHGDHKHIDDPDWTPCVGNVFDFVTALLFSIETQHTIGYGSRAMETKCPEAVVLLMLQSCTGVFFQSLMTGIIFAKLSRPKSRSSTIRFSKHAVVCQRDGRFCLLFRVADMRKSHLVSAIVRAIMVKNVITKEGEPLPLCQSLLKTEAENGGEDNSVYLIWPTTVIHWIDEDSPFWNMSAEEMLTDRFEIVVFLEGTVESTGMTTQVRTSYLPTEILWGHRLAPLVTYQKHDGQYRVDYTLFHSSIPVAIPECSPKEALERQQSLEANQPTRTHLSYVDRLRHVRENNVSESNLAVPSSFSMGAGPARGSVDTGQMIYVRERTRRRPSLTKNVNGDVLPRRARSLKVRSRTALHGLASLLSPSSKRGKGQGDSLGMTDTDERPSPIATTPSSIAEEREIVEAESVA